MKGHLGGVPAVPGACAGVVTVRIDADARAHRSKARVGVHRFFGHCKFRARFRLTGRRIPKRIRVTASFGGNSLLNPVERSISVR